MKDALRASSSFPSDSSWLSKLPDTLLALRNEHKEEIGASPAQLLFGSQLRESATPALNRAIFPDPPVIPPDFTTEPRVKEVKPRVPSDLEHCTEILVRSGGIRHNTLDLPFAGPFKVTRRTRSNVYIMKNGKEVPVTIDRCRPYRNGSANSGGK